MGSVETITSCELRWHYMRVSTDFATSGKEFLERLWLLLVLLQRLTLYSTKQGSSLTPGDY